MPYVSESSSDPGRYYTVGQSGSASGTTSFPNGRRRSQYGYRTKSLTPAEVAGIQAGPSASWNMLSHIRLLEETSGDVADIGFKYHDMRYWPVHDRDYTETVFSPSGFNSTFRVVPFKPLAEYTASLQGAIGFTGTQAGVLPADPGTSSARNIAAEMLRSSRPQRQDFSLSRFAAEQREAGLLLKASNYIPRSPRELGGAVLNFLFGLRPTGEDLGTALALCVKSHPVVQELLALEKVVERRYNTRVLSTNRQTGRIQPVSFATDFTGTTYYTGYSSFRVVKPAPFGSVSSYGNVLNPLYLWTWEQTQMVRTFATWEYFVPHPLGLPDRLPAYQLAAKNLLDSFEFKPSVVYDLTPWTWLGNWFVDIGGLLRYQEAIAENQMVSTGSGYSIITQYGCDATFAGFVPTSTNGDSSHFLVESKRFSPVTATVRQKRITRRGSSPYAVGPTWDLSLQQWGILGALGLAKGPNMPNIAR